MDVAPFTDCLPLTPLPPSSCLTRLWPPTFPLLTVSLPQAFLLLLFMCSFPVASCLVFSSNLSHSLSLQRGVWSTMVRAVLNDLGLLRFHRHFVSLLQLSILSICFLSVCCPPFYHILHRFTGSSKPMEVFFHSLQSYSLPPSLCSFTSFFFTHSFTLYTHSNFLNSCLPSISITLLFMHSSLTLPHSHVVSSSLSYDLLPLHYTLPTSLPSTSYNTDPQRGRPQHVSPPVTATIITRR